MFAVVKLPNLWSHNAYLSFVNFCLTHITIEKKEKRELILLIEYLVMEHLFGVPVGETEECTDGEAVLKRLRDKIQDIGSDLLLGMECDTDCEGVANYDYILTSSILKTEGKFLDLDQWSQMLAEYLANVDASKFELISRRINTIQEWYNFEKVEVDTQFEISLEDFKWTGEVYGKCRHRIEVEL